MQELKYFNTQELLASLQTGAFKECCAEELWCKLELEGEILNGFWVSSCGRIRYPSGRLAHIGEKSTASSYATLDVQKQKFLVHRLVALVFVAGYNKSEKRVFVNHKDGNRRNNHVTNLEWATQKENCQHAWDTRLQPKRLPKPSFQVDQTIIEKIQKLEGLFLRKV